MGVIKNPKGLHATILHGKNKNLKMVVPDEIEALPGEFVEWVVEPSNLQVTITFDSSTGSPFAWLQKKGPNGTHRGTVERNAGGYYKYTVEDDNGNTMDPRVRVKR
jgi:plastocyanin